MSFRVCRSGWAELLHHLLTVQVDLPSFSASHFPVFPCSTRTTLTRFNFNITSNCFDLNAKVFKYYKNQKLSFYFYYYLAVNNYYLKKINKADVTKWQYCFPTNSVFTSFFTSFHQTTKLPQIPKTRNYNSYKRLGDLHRQLEGFTPTLSLPSYLII